MGTDKDSNSQCSKTCNTSTRYTPSNEWWNENARKSSNKKMKQGKNGCN
jgi:hypothetical protein